MSVRRFLPPLVAAALAATAACAFAQGAPADLDPRPTGTVMRPMRPSVPTFDLDPARDLPVELAQEVVPPRPAVEQPAKVDETALRYFARQGDTRRLNAEIARLKALYPDWTPPADPLAVPVNRDEQLDAMWQLYADHKFAEARQAIAKRQQDEPGWTPPADLLERLGVAEARDRLINASNLKQYDTVIRLGSENPSLLTCSEVDVLWRVGAAFAQTDRPARAADAYRYILNNCDNTQERVATMRNALALLPLDIVDELMSLERTDGSGQGEFAPVRDDIARKAVSEAGQDAAATVAPDQLQRVEALATDERNASDSLLLGWYYFRRDDMGSAEKWFRQAHEIDRSAESAQGFALTLVARQAFLEAEDVLYPWRDTNDDTRSSYLAAVANLLGVEPRLTLSGEVLQRMAAATAAGRDVPAGQQFGWYARAFNQFQTAAEWFTRALSWNPDHEPSAYGLALTLNQLGDEAGVAEIQRIWRGRSERIAMLGEEDTRRGLPQRSPDTTLPAEGDTTTGQRPRAALPATTPPAGSSTSSGELPVMSYSAAETRARTPAATARAAPTVSEAPAAPSVGMAPARSERAATGESRERATARRGCADIVPPATLSAAAALTRGWCLMEADRPMEAAEAFERALQSGNERTRSDAAYGQSLAYLRAGLVDDASVAAAKAPQNRARVGELQSSILAERALGAFEQRRYVEVLIALDQRAQIAPERVDLMVLRGYAYLNLNRLAEARTVFEAASATGSRDALRGLAALNESNSGR